MLNSSPHFYYNADCPVVEVPNGYAKTSGGRGPGSRLVLECQKGATLVGRVYYECFSNGSWSGEIGKCVLGKIITSVSYFDFPCLIYAHPIKLCRHAFTPTNVPKVLFICRLVMA